MKLGKESEGAEILGSAFGGKPVGEFLLDHQGQRGKTVREKPFEKRRGDVVGEIGDDFFCGDAVQREFEGVGAMNR